MIFSQEKAKEKRSVKLLRPKIRLNRPHSFCCSQKKNQATGFYLFIYLFFKILKASKCNGGKWNQAEAVCLFF